MKGFSVVKEDDISTEVHEYIRQRDLKEKKKDEVEYDDLGLKKPYFPPTKL